VTEWVFFSARPHVSPPWLSFHLGGLTQPGGLPHNKDDDGVDGAAMEKTRSSSSSSVNSSLIDAH